MHCCHHAQCALASSLATTVLTSENAGLHHTAHNTSSPLHPMEHHNVECCATLLCVKDLPHLCFGSLAQQLLMRLRSQAGIPGESSGRMSCEATPNIICTLLSPE